MTAILIVTCLSSLGLYLFARDPYSEHEIRRLIDPSYSQQRPGGGRLSGASYVPVRNSGRTSPDVGKAQLLLLSQPDSESRRRLQGLIYLAAGDWQKFTDIAASSHAPTDAADLNNLGASFLGLSEQNPSYLLKALDAFERATHLSPKAPEPLFNLVVVYRKLHFPKLADDNLRKLATLDSGVSWVKDLQQVVSIDEAGVADQLRTAIDRNNIPEAEQLFNANPELSRRLVMQYPLT